MDDYGTFLVFRLGPKTSECEMKIGVKSTVAVCEVSNPESGQRTITQVFLTRHINKINRSVVDNAVRAWVDESILRQSQVMLISVVKTN